MQLQIRHVGESQEGRPLFTVVFNGKQDTRLVQLMPPWNVNAETQNSNLQQDLQWYLEKYLELPIERFRTRAGSVQAELKQWGQDSFDALLGGGHARDWYRDARQKLLSNLCLKIVSDNPAVLSWPWEALESRDDGLLAQQCRIERQLDNIGDVYPIPDNLLTMNQLNILYIIARPYGDRDVGFQTLARPLIDFINEDGWPVHIDVLRPPTFNRLRMILEEKPNYYHIVHFDGHGGFGYLTPASGPLGQPVMRDRYAAPSGALVFETDDQKEDIIPAAKLGELLRPHNIPVMILNACQSAMIDAQADDPFTSVAVSLLKAGIRSVVAMSYSLWVSGARVFVPAFYKRLFRNGETAEAMQAARREMYEKNMRDTYFGQMEFNDWIVPVLYQQSAEGILPELEPGAHQERKLPEEALELGEYGFIGRDRAIQRLERAIRLKPPGILIHGMAGEGKTTLAKGFLQWLESTNGSGAGAVWFNFEDIQSAGYIIDMLADSLLGTRAISLPTEKKLAEVTRILKANTFFIVWDNFESASGIPGTEVSALLSDNDRKLLKQFLNSLRGGKTKILITSRSPENWLTVQECYRLPLGGLEGEELWQYCNAVVADLGLSLDREGNTYKELMDKLEGNPLAVRAILLRLNERPAEALLADLEDAFEGIEGDNATKRIQAALSVFELGLNRAFAPALRLLGLHMHYAHADFIGYMLKRVDETEPFDDCFTALENAGLCRPIGNNIYRLHPALRSCLTRLHPATESDQRAFVGVLGDLADAFARKELYEYHSVYTLFSACFHQALKLARELDLREDVLVLTQGLAIYAYQSRNFSEAERLNMQRIEAVKEYGRNDLAASSTYNQLGVIAQEGRDFDAAEDWYKKALAIELEQGNEYSAAINYHQLGSVAQDRRDFDAAENWYKKALAIKLKQGNEHGAASTYHQLGMVAHERRDFDAAEDWYKKSLAIELKQGNEHGEASACTYHQLGMIAQEKRDFDVAEDWYKKSLVIELKLENEHGAANTYHQLGMAAQERRDFDAAEDWYKKALAIDLKQGNEYGAAITYHQLGMAAQERWDFDAAEDWYKKSLEINLKQANEYGAASTYHQLGMVAQERGDIITAEDCYNKSLEIKLKWDDEHDIAMTYWVLGGIKLLSENINTAEDLYNKALIIFTKYNDMQRINDVKHDLARLDDIRNGGTSNDSNT